MMTNAELREAIRETSELVHDLYRRTSPADMERETRPHREHLKTLLAAEAARASVAPASDTGQPAA